MRGLATILVACWILLSCEDPIQIDLPTNSNLLVVEGWISNQLVNQEITLSQTQGFNDQSEPSLVSEAQVTVFNNLNESFSFEQLESGIYQSADPFRAVDSLFYQLEIVLTSGDTIVSPFESVPRSVLIDSVAFRDVPIRSNENPNIIETIYFPVTFSQDPSDIRNYYRWKISRNDSLFNSPNDLELLDDSAINGNFFPNEFRSFQFEFGDTLNIEMQTISKGAFDFLSLLKSQTTLLGTASGTLPATLTGNLRNRTNENQIVLGYFGCFSSSEAELVLLEE